MPSRNLPTFLFGLAVGLTSISFATGQDTTTTPQVTTDAQVAPLGPAIGSSTIEAAGFHSTVQRNGETFRVAFPIGRNRPEALFIFPTMDWSLRLGGAADITNLGDESLRVYGHINRNLWSQGYVLIPPGATRTLYVFMHRTELTPPSLSSVFEGMLGIPGGQMELWPEANIDAATITSLGVFVVAPKRPVTIEVSRIQPFGSARPPSEQELGDGFFPFIDRYGQLLHKEWPGKIHSDAELISSDKAEVADLQSHPRPADWDQYGGWNTGPTLRASGHFRTEKFKGKWWLVDPAGHLFWSQGVAAILAGGPNWPNIPSHAKYFEDPPADANYARHNLRIKYGEQWQQVWQQRMQTRLPSWGYNTVGGFSDSSIPNSHKVPYTWFFRSRGTGNYLDTNVERRMTDLRKQMMEVASQLNSDPWCLGIFVDNEIHETDPAWWKSYYASIHVLVRELFPNKLYLGSRLDFHDWPNSSPERYAIVRIAAQYVDVISFNQYRFTFEDFRLPKDIDVPVIVGEFHFGALDRGLNHTGLRSVLDQDQRADAYSHFMETALQDPNIVGAHWFMLYDEPATGTNFGGGENFQIGLLDVCDQPYSETISAARTIGREMYKMRLVDTVNPFPIGTP